MNVPGLRGNSHAPESHPGFWGGAESVNPFPRDVGDCADARWSNFAVTMAMLSGESRY